MESTPLTKRFISSRGLLIILVLHFLLSGRLSGAATPYIGNSTSSTTASGSIDVEFEAGAVVLSTWESASTHRILAQTQKLSVVSSTKRTAACNSAKYSNCIRTASGAAARPCNDFNRCSRNNQ